MNLNVEKEFAEKLAARFKSLKSLTSSLRYGHDTVELSVTKLTEKQLDYLHELYTAGGPTQRGKAAQISTLKKALHASDTANFKAQDLSMLVPAITKWLLKDIHRGWLFKMNPDGKPVAFVVIEVYYSPPGQDSPASVMVKMVANSCGKVSSESMHWGSGDIVRKTVTELIAEKGFLKETPELLEEYDRAEKIYIEWRQDISKQFLARGIGFDAEKGNDYWRRSETIVLASGELEARLVNDEDTLKERSLTLESRGLRLKERQRGYRSRDEDDEEVEGDADEGKALLVIPEDKFKQMPVHPYIYMFHLDLHQHVWAHVADMKPYVYRPEIKDKLILPSHQMDLIDILTADISVLAEDIVAGKTGGTTILCAGKPGVGKTLTAEVYAEVVKKPLYRVHSGQLGLDAQSLEKELQEILTRAQRWGAVMLIDEADVYIKRRDDNLEMNAVVGVFLRVLEYFNGLLFLTTNRLEDIDEAIQSRAIAVIHYGVPEADARRSIWKVMLTQYGLTVSDKLLEDLVVAFPEATGRDIKGLTKLVEKFCRNKKQPVSLEAFRKCSVFRGLDYHEPGQLFKERFPEANLEKKKS